MTRPLDRDDPLDAVLERALNRAAGEVGDCPDADALGAFAERRLSAPERARVEAHAADCDRCQAVLAALVRTDHLVPAAAAGSPWRRFLAPAWLLPATAGLAALAIWVAVQQTPSPSTQEAAARSVAPAAPAAPAGGAAPYGGGNVPPAADETAALRLERRAPSPSPDGPSPSRPAPFPVEKGTSPGQVPPVPSLADSRERVDASSARSAPAAPPVPAAPPPAPPAAPDAAATADLAGVPRAVPPLATEAEQQAKARAEAAPLAQNEIVGSARAAESPWFARQLVSGLRILTPDPARLWMIEPGGHVLRSTDGGASFQPQPTNTTTPLAAGAAPSPEVCWIVGSDGVVLLTTDGRTWRRVDVPEPAALSNVAATSAANAVVTAADGRRWATDNGGRTWRLLAPPPGR